MTIANQFALEILMNGMSEFALAKETGVPRATINRVLTGKTPDPKISTLLPIAQYFGVTIEQLLGLSPLPTSDTMVNEASDVIKIPYLEFDHIRNWLIKAYDPSTYHEIVAPDSSHVDNTCYLLKVNNAVMSPTFSEGALIVVNPSIQAEHNDHVIYYIKADNSVVIRKLFVDGRDKYLTPNNSTFRTILINNEDECLGVVVEVKNILK